MEKLGPVGGGEMGGRTRELLAYTEMATLESFLILYPLFSLHSFILYRYFILNPPFFILNHSVILHNLL